MIVLESEEDNIKLEISFEDGTTILKSDELYGLFHNNFNKYEYYDELDLRSLINDWKDSGSSMLYFDNIILERIYNTDYMAVERKYTLTILQQIATEKQVIYLSDFTCKFIEEV